MELRFRYIGDAFVWLSDVSDGPTNLSGAINYVLDGPSDVSGGIDKVLGGQQDVDGGVGDGFGGRRDGDNGRGNRERGLKVGLRVVAGGIFEKCWGGTCWYRRRG